MTAVLFLIYAVPHPGVRAHAAEGCEGPGFSAWAADWTSPNELAASLQQVSRLRTLWLGALVFETEKNEFKAVERPVFKKIREATAQAGTCLGAYFHNSGPRGFDPALGLAILRAPDASLSALAELARRQGWKAVQVDLESLPETAAAEYESFLSRLIAKLKPAGVRVSVALHAKTSEPGAFAGARFQRWKELSAKDLDFVIMAYDFHWATSAPGPVAPWEWVQAVSRYALSIFPAERLVIGLPNYGYHWKRKDAASSWSGTPLLSQELMRTLKARKGWSAQKLASAADGEHYRHGQLQEIAFDGPKALEEKARLLAAEPLRVRRLAIWRLGGMLPTFD